MKKKDERVGGAVERGGVGRRSGREGSRLVYSIGWKLGQAVYL